MNNNNNNNNASLSKRTRVIGTIGVFTFIATLMVVILSRFQSASMQISFNNNDSVPRRKVVFAFGDSLTAGTSGDKLYPYVNYLHLSPPEAFQVHHVGLPGWRTQSMLDFASDPQRGLRSALKATQPDLVVLLAGTNDLGEVSAQEIFENLQALHGMVYSFDKDTNNKVRRKVPRQTIGIGIPSSKYQTMVPAAAEKAQAVNHLLQAWQEEESRFNYMPFPFDYNDETTSGGLWHSDGLHFTEEGYKRLAQAVAPKVELILEEFEDSELTKQ